MRSSVARGWVCLLVLAAGCTSVPSQLEGSWRAAGDHGEGHSWYKEVTLDGDAYSLSGYPPLTETATVGGVEEVGPRRWKLTLTDHVFHGEPADDQELEIELAPDGRSFELGGQTYRRVDPN